MLGVTNAELSSKVVVVVAVNVDVVAVLSSHSIKATRAVRWQPHDSVIRWVTLVRIADELVSDSYRSSRRVQDTFQ
jgi:hypothetical protein